MTRFVERGRAMPERTPVTDLVGLDEEFHEQVSVLSRNGEVLRVLKNINARIRFCRWIDMENGRRSKTPSEHAEILAAIKARNPERCTQATNQHISRRLDQIVEVIREGYARIYMGEYAQPRKGKSRSARTFGPVPTSCPRRRTHRAQAPRW